MTQPHEMTDTEKELARLQNGYRYADMEREHEAANPPADEAGAVTVTVTIQYVKNLESALNKIAKISGPRADGKNYYSLICEISQNALMGKSV